MVQVCRYGLGRGVGMLLVCLTLYVTYSTCIALNTYYRSMRPPYKPYLFAGHNTYMYAISTCMTIFLTGTVITQLSSETINPD